MRRRELLTQGRGSFELLEPKLLLASDACPHDDDETAAQIADASPVATDTYSALEAGSTFGTAFGLGQLGATRSYAGSVGGSDPSDVMRFSLANQAQVAIQLSGLRSDIDLFLYNAAGQRLSVSSRGGAATESVSRTLAAGDYYIVVAPWRTAVSTYTLSVGATYSAPPTAAPTPTTPTPTTPTPTTPTTPTPSTPVAAFPDVAYYGGTNEWNINSVNAPESWAQGYTGQGVVVAVVDTGVDMNHPDLVSQIWVNAGETAGNGIDDDRNGYVDDVSGWDFSGGDNNPDDGNGHGTHVAGTIAADNNGFGVTGVAPDAKIMPVRVLGNDGSGTAAAVAAGIRYAAQMGADIINLSLGGTLSSVIQSAIQFAQQRNVLVVAAAGNDGGSSPIYPARFSASLNNVISVGAYSSSGARASFSDRVGASGAVQVDAPGVSVYSTYMGGGYARLSGTSMATPHVAGLAALALSANQNLTAAQLRTVIVSGADRTISGSDSRGGIDAALTVALAATGQTSSASSSSATVQAAAASQVISARGFIVSPVDPATPSSPVFTPGADHATSQESVAPNQLATAAQRAPLPQYAARDAALLAIDTAAEDEPDVVSDPADTDPSAELCLDEVFGDGLAEWLDQAAFSHA